MLVPSCGTEARHGTPPHVRSLVNDLAPAADALSPVWPQLCDICSDRDDAGGVA